MEFDLTTEIIDQIIFAMEDQTQTWVVDTGTGVVSAVAGRPDRYPAPRFVPAPVWKPTDGYLLMERFVGGLRNAALADELRQALNSGRGVFRSFKDALRRNPEVERRWYRFKERSMRHVVYEWYNQVRELRGLERLSLEPPEESDELEELIESDFLFVTDPGSRGASIEAADRSAFAESLGDLDPSDVEALYRARRSGMPAVDHPSSRLVLAEDHAGQLAGFVWAERHASSRSPGESLRIAQVWVSPGYRGIGLATALVRRLVELSAADGLVRVSVELGEGALGLSGLFLEQGFRPVSQVLAVDLGSRVSGETDTPNRGGP